MPNSLQRKFTLGRVSDQFYNEELHKVYEATKHILDIPKDQEVSPGEAEQDGALWLNRRKNELQAYDKSSKEWKPVFKEKFQIVDQMTNLLPPVNPVSGQLWLYNDVLTYWNGTKWAPVKALEQDGSQFSMSVLENFYMCSPLLKQKNTVINDSEFDKYGEFVKTSCQDIVDNYKNRFNPKDIVTLPDVNDIKLAGSTQFIVPNIELDRVFMNEALDDKYNKQTPVCIDYPKTYLEGKTPSLIHINPGHLSSITKRFVKVDKLNPTINIAPANTEYYGFVKGSSSGDFLRQNSKDAKGGYDAVSTHIYLAQESAKKYDYVLAVTYDFSWYRTNGTMVRSTNQDDAVSYYVADYAGPMNVFVDGYNLDDTSVNVDNLGKTITVDEDIHNMELSALHSTKQECGIVQDLDAQNRAVIKLTKRFNTPLVFMNGEALHDAMGDYEKDKEKNTLYVLNGKKGMTWSVIELFDKQHDYNMFVSAGIVSDVDDNNTPIIEYDPELVDNGKDNIVLFTDGLLVKKEDVVRKDITRKYIKKASGNLVSGSNYILMTKDDINKSHGKVEKKTIDGKPYVQINAEDANEKFLLYQDGNEIDKSLIRIEDVDERCIIQDGLKSNQEYAIAAGENTRLTTGVVSELNSHGENVIRYINKTSTESPKDLAFFIDGMLIDHGDAIIKNVEEKYIIPSCLNVDKGTEQKSEYTILRGEAKTVSGIITEQTADGTPMIRFDKAISQDDINNMYIVCDGKLIDSQSLKAKEVDEGCIAADGLKTKQEYRLFQNNSLTISSGTVKGKNLQGNAYIPYEFTYGKNYMLFVDGTYINHSDIIEATLHTENIYTENMVAGQEYILLQKDDLQKCTGTITEKSSNGQPLIVYNAEDLGNNIGNVDLYIEGIRVDNTKIYPIEADVKCVTTANLKTGQEVMLLSQVAEKVEYGFVHEKDHFNRPAIKSDMVLSNEGYALFVNGILIDNKDVVAEKSKERFLSYTELKDNDEYILINDENIDITGKVTAVDRTANPIIKCPKDKIDGCKVFVDGVENTKFTPVQYDELCITAADMKTHQACCMVQDNAASTVIGKTFEDSTTKNTYINVEVKDETELKNYLVFIDGLYMSTEELSLTKVENKNYITVQGLRNNQSFAVTVIPNMQSYSKTAIQDGRIDCKQDTDMNHSIVFVDGLMIPQSDYLVADNGNGKSLVIPFIKKGQIATIVTSVSMVFNDSTIQYKDGNNFVRMEELFSRDKKETISIFVDGLFAEKDYVYVKHTDTDAISLDPTCLGKDFFILSKDTIKNLCGTGKVEDKDAMNRPVVKQDSTKLKEDAFTLIVKSQTAAAQVIKRERIAITDGPDDCFLSVDGLSMDQEYAILHGTDTKIFNGTVKNYEETSKRPFIDCTSLGITPDNIKRYALFIDGIMVNPNEIKMEETIYTSKDATDKDVVHKSHVIYVPGMKIGQGYNFISSSNLDTLVTEVLTDHSTHENKYIKYTGKIAEEQIDKAILFVDGMMTKKDFINISESNKQCISTDNLKLGQNYMILDKRMTALHKGTVTTDSRGKETILIDLDKVNNSSIALILNGKVIDPSAIVTNINQDEKRYVRANGLQLNQEYKILEAEGKLEIHEDVVSDVEENKFAVINYGKYSITDEELKDTIIFIEGIQVNNSEIGIDANKKIFYINGLEFGQQYAIIKLPKSFVKYGTTEKNTITDDIVIRYSDSFSREQAEKSILFVDGILTDKNLITINTSDKRCIVAGDKLAIGKQYEILDKRNYIIESMPIKDHLPVSTEDKKEQYVINYEFPTDESNRILLFIDGKSIASSDYTLQMITKKIHLSTTGMKAGQQYTIMEDLTCMFMEADQNSMILKLLASTIYHRI